MITLNNVSKFFNTSKGSVTGLDNVSVSLDRGELLTVNGPSGCGKSTLLLTAAGLLKPDQGEVRFQDQNPYELSPEKRSSLRAGLIGFVFQQFHLIPYLTVRENVIVPSLSIHNDDPEKRVTDLLQGFGLQDRADHVPSQLSIGERQRTAMARALFNKPRVIMADEPTGNLDEENSDIVLNYLKDYVSEGGSVLLVSHSLKAAGFATRVIRMKGGMFVS